MEVELPSGTLEKSVKSSMEGLKALAASANVDVGVEVRVGHPYKTILEVAKEKSADLIIVASHQPGLQDYFLGSTAAKVVRHMNVAAMLIQELHYIDIRLPARPPECRCSISCGGVNVYF